ncbi:MAG: response regulator transcription factor [Sandaracinaceae bacterium]|nr:response regulator transcription factor [Sandaracinaceae bacterium]
MRLLLVEDDEAIAQKLQKELLRAGHECVWREGVADGLGALRAEGAELVLLDLTLPDGSGFRFIEEARGESQVPIIVLSARLVSSDKVRALELGADDYVTKPFWVDELLARIAAVTRRHQAVPRPGVRYRFDDVVVDLTAMTAEVDGAPAELTPTEFDLLAYLLQHPDEALSTDRLGERVLVSEGAGPDALRVHVSRLRKKLGASGGRVETVWGIGYRFVSPSVP